MGGSLEGPLEEIAGWGEQWDYHPQRLAAVPSPQQRAVPSLPVSPPLPLPTDYYSLQWDGGGMANTWGPKPPEVPMLQDTQNSLQISASELQALQCEHCALLERHNRVLQEAVGKEAELREK